MRAWFLAGLLGILMILIPCLTFGGTPQGHENGIGTSQSTARGPTGPAWKGDGGKGITIAVPTPALYNAATNDKWLPQFFQDRITGDLAKYSAMTVIDRSNEQLALAEQNLSISGNYSDNDYIRIGHLTNAQLIVAGGIQNVSGRYNISFRINNTETNEIKASFDKLYSLSDVENGLAAKEAVSELLAGMGIELTDKGKQSLLAVQSVEARATAQLARGAAAAKSGDEIEALVFFTDALTSNTTKAEADRNIQKVFAVSAGAGIRERANYAQAQMEKWKKIFDDLRAYLDKNMMIVVYDFSITEDEINMSGAGSVAITIKPGIKVVPNRSALAVHRKILDAWGLVKTQEENKTWVNQVRPRNYSSAFGRTFRPIIDSDFDGIYYDLQIESGLYDDYGDCIKKVNIRPFTHIEGKQILISQQKYYENARFYSIKFDRIPLKDITDTLTPKIERVVWGYVSENKQTGFVFPAMSVAEYQQWQSSQGNTR